MVSLVMIFVVAFLACGAVHWANSDSARRRAEAQVVSRNILTGASDSRARAGGVARQAHVLSVAPVLAVPTQMSNNPR